MKSNIRLFIRRRGMIKSLVGIMPLLFLTNSKSVQAKKIEIKALCRSLELEAIEKSKPRKDPTVSVSDYDGKAMTLLSREGGNRPICAINRAGKAVWEWCNGENTPKDISRLLQRHYQVSIDQACSDCLAFLADLRQKGAIKL